MRVSFSPGDLFPDADIVLGCSKAFLSGGIYIGRSAVTNFWYLTSYLDKLGLAFDYRDWLAHGRYWRPKNSPHIAEYDYLAIYLLATDILEKMDLVES